MEEKRKKEKDIRRGYVISKLEVHPAHSRHLKLLLLNAFGLEAMQQCTSSTAGAVTACTTQASAGSKI